MTITELFIKILRFQINGQAADDEIRESLNSENLKELYALSKTYDLAHVVAKFLSDNGLCDDVEISKKFNKELILSIYRYEKLKHTLNESAEALEGNNIPFVPLKGAVVRDLYDTPYMRSSCDTDLLVHESDLEKAVYVLEEKCGCVVGEKGKYDVALDTGIGSHIELHWYLEAQNAEADRVLQTVWNNVSLCEGYKNRYRMSDEFFILYHTAHMSKHFKIGGCGVRPFIDLWVMKRKLNPDNDRLTALLKEAGLYLFYQSAISLAESWFSGGEPTGPASDMERFVFRGSLYGGFENRLVINSNKKGGKLKYVISRLYLPYESLINHYPSLEGKKYLLPAYNVRRALKLLFCGGIRRSVKEIKTVKDISNKESEFSEKLFKELGL